MTVELFISHAHADEELAQRLVDVIEAAMSVPAKALRCTSVGGYKLALGDMPRDVLRQELSSAKCVIALMTPNSIDSAWCQFELGAAWVLAKETIPLLAGGVRNDTAPGALGGANMGDLEKMSDLSRLLEQLRDSLGWPERNRTAALDKIEILAKLAAKTASEADHEKDASFTSKLSMVGGKQRDIVDYVVHRRAGRPHIPQAELEDAFSTVPTHLFYRLEQLRLLGFLKRQQIGHRGNNPDYGWTLSRKYEDELGPIKFHRR
jgi:hypothetical protein